MSINNFTRPKIAHFGAFDHDSYGDLIFPHIVEHFLPEFKFVHISPSGMSTPWNDAKNTYGSGNRGRIGKDDIRRKRYPITAACGQIRH